MNLKFRKIIFFLLKNKKILFLFLFILFNFILTLDLELKIKKILETYQNDSFLIFFNFFLIYNILGLIILNFLIFYLYKKLQKDNLTNLLKREFLYKNFDLLKKIFPKISIIFIDLDNFKVINDTAGHDVGDKVLKKVAKILLNHFGKEFVGRIGGDEFVALVPYEDKKELKKRLQNLLKELNLEISHKELFYKISASIGVGFYPEHSENIKDLIKKADIAMYEKKKNNKNGINFYTIETENNKKRELRIKNSLENILFKRFQKNDYKLEVFFQPQIGIKKRNLKGAEALIRFKFSENLEYLSPMEFLDIAYQNNLIYYIDLFVFETICKKIREWLDNGYKPVLISVNLTFQNLENSKFIENLYLLTEQYNVPKSYIGLEITEETLIKNFYKSKKVINELKSLGFHIAIDDFGTGYSNYSYIKDLPFDKLKIDKKFIYSLPNYKDEIILKSIMVISRGFELETIAEGVETEEQLEILKNLGVDQIQGYYFSKPLPIDEFEKKYIFNQK